LKDLAIELANRPGELARMGEALGRAGLSIEGGGAFVAQGKGLAHFLFADGAAARAALEQTGVVVFNERDVVVQKLRQSEPGHLGKLCRLMEKAKVNIETLYSDHNNQLVLVVDNIEKAREVSQEWMRRP
jgi:hypothetical protein